MDVRDQRLLDRIQEMNHDMETRMLKAFYSYAEGNNQRVIEKRLNLPPAA